MRLAPGAEAFSPAGMSVAVVVDGGMAATAGVIPGDRVVRIAGLPVRSLAELGAALRRAGGEATVELELERDGAIRTAAVPLIACPREELPKTHVAYEHLEVPGARLRTIITAPVATPPIAAVLWLQGISCESIDHGGSAGSSVARLIAGWAEAGVLTMRVDRRGVGDSDGGPCGDDDFATDLDDHGAALQALAADPRAAGVPRLLFGHSVGGMVAAVLAVEDPVDGIMVYGTSPATWLTCVAASTHRQLAMRLHDPAEVERGVAAAIAQIRRHGGSGRNPTYHAQLDTLDLEAAWAATSAPRVLVLHGEHDWVVGRDEQQRIVDIVEARRPGAATLVDLPGLDHLLGWHPDRESSVVDYGNGRADPAIVAATLEWIRAAGLRSTP